MHRCSLADRIEGAQQTARTVFSRELPRRLATCGKSTSSANRFLRPGKKLDAYSLDIICATMEGEVLIACLHARKLVSLNHFVAVTHKPCAPARQFRAHGIAQCPKPI